MSERAPKQVDETICRKLQGRAEIGNACLQNPGTCDSCPDWANVINPPKKKRAPKCKHRNLDKNLRCKACGAKVDIREKRSKYGNRRTDGFDSAKEARRYRELSNDPTVFGIERQKEYDLILDGELICKYRADFVYLRVGDDKVWHQVVEDVKPSGKAFKKTAAYQIFRMKKVLMKLLKHIDVVEV